VSDPSRSATDAASVGALLGRESTICTGCITAQLALTMPRVLAAIHDFGRTHTLEQGMGSCPVCGRTKWVVSLVK